MLDLARLCERDSERDPSRMLVLAAGELEAAVPVTQVTGIHAVPDDDISPPVEDAGPTGVFCSGQFQLGGSVYSLLDVERLLRRASPAEHPA